MSEAIHGTTIRAEVVTAHSHCPRKAFLFHCTEDQGVRPEYLTILKERTNVTRTRYLADLQQTNTAIRSYGNGAISSGSDVLTEASLRAADLAAYCDVLTRVSSTRRDEHAAYEYQPTIIVGTLGIQREQILNLSFAGYVLGQLQGKTPAVGHLVTVGGERHRTNLQATYKTVRSIVSQIRGWSIDPPAQPPPVVLNKHCPYCPFKIACTELAEAADDLSLLDRMTPKAIRRYHSKGIFTVNQLSYVYKPRRSRRRPQRSGHFDLQIQALAIRTGKIYIQTLPQIQRRDIELFLDIEGVPDQQFSYLIGLLVCDHGVTTHYSYWADTADDEGSIWQMFVQKANDYPDAPIYHYGSYEARLIESVVKRLGPESGSISGRLVNLISEVYGKVYFPVRSNGLKVLGRFLGASWTEPDASGLQSLVWRSRWEEQRAVAYKHKLISYNAEDCQALRLVLEELARLRTNADSELKVDYVDQPKQHSTRLGSELHAALDHVLLYASVNYPKSRISFRPETDAGKRKGLVGAPKGHQGYVRAVPLGRRKVIRVAPKRRCPKHRGERLQGSGTDAEKIIVDLVFTKNGCRKVVIKYAGDKRHCPRCRRSYNPPAVKKLGKGLFGHGFQAWAVYQRIILRLPYHVITQTMEDLFRERTTEATVINFIESFAEYYGRTESILVKRLLESPFVHVDETRLSIQGVDHYVWVFTDGRHVVFRLTETREAAVVHELLAGYKGVLVSDFYPGYDAVECRQEKCWVHLIRDLNEDLWKFPFDAELQEFVLAVKNLIVPIIEAIDQYGLRTKHLCRFKNQVDEFYAAAIESREYALDVTKKYQKRLARYRESLFRFLDEDGIPWNNNMAERAIRHLAIQRKISGTFFKRAAVQYLELLGIAQTCRFQEKSFLKFLLSQEIDVDRFQSASRIRISRGVDRDPTPCPAEDAANSR